MEQLVHLHRTPDALERQAIRLGATISLHWQTRRIVAGARQACEDRRDAMSRAAAPQEVLPLV